MLDGYDSLSASRERLAGCADGVGGGGKIRRVTRTDDTGGQGHGAQTNGSLGGIGAEGDEDLRNVVEVLVGLELEGVFWTVAEFL